MVTTTEREVMKIIYNGCGGKKSCLLSYQDIIQALPEKHKIDETTLKKVLKSLELDDYYEIIDSDRKGEKMLCFNLHLKGQSFLRDMTQTKRNIGFRVGLAVAIGMIGLLFAIAKSSV